MSDVRKELMDRAHTPFHDNGLALRTVKALDARDAEIARLREAVRKHHDDVWGEHGPVTHDADADLYEAAGVRLGDGTGDEG